MLCKLGFPCFAFAHFCACDATLTKAVAQYGYSHRCKLESCSWGCEGSAVSTMVKSLSALGSHCGRKQAIKWGGGVCGVHHRAATSNCFHCQSTYLTNIFLINCLVYIKCKKKKKWNRHVRISQSPKWCLHISFFAQPWVQYPKTQWLKHLVNDQNS